MVDCVRLEELALGEYVDRSEEWMLKVVAGMMEVGETKFDKGRQREKRKIEREGNAWEIF